VRKSFSRINNFVSDLTQHCKRSKINACMEVQKEGVFDVFSHEKNELITITPPFSWLASTNETRIETNITNMMSVGEPSHETIETETIATMRKCSILALYRGRMRRCN
jgi:hypothetical protein